jgi:hypothetical protein
MVKRINLVASIFFILLIAIYFISSGGETHFNHFSRLADAFLQGDLFVTAEAPYLEQVPIDKSHFYVPYPPMPAILLMPFRLLFGSTFPQDFLGYLLGAGAAVLMMKVSFILKKDLRLAVWTGLLTGIGTIVWFMSSVSSSWYLGQLSGYFFLTLAIHSTLTKKDHFIIGMLIGASYLSRIELMVTLPFFLFMNKEGNWFKNFVSIGLGILPFVLFNFYYNFARFGVIWDKAYTLIPGVSTESWYEKGVLHLSYIPRHLEIVFGALPAFKNEFPFFKPGMGGLAIWFTTPAFLYSLRASLKEKMNLLSWLSIGLISLIIFSHGTTGFAQFGYRFAVDFYPFLILLVIKGITRKDLAWHHWLLLIMGISVNLWGVLFINKLDWASF